MFRSQFKASLILLLIVLAGGLTTALGMKTAAPPVATPPPAILRFLALGDMGAGTPAQKAIARQMWAVHQKTPVAGILLLGDIIYETGDVATLGESHFRKPYQAFLSAKVPFYGALGNHDILTHDGREMIAFLKMPGRYYTFIKGSGTNQIQFFALDTNHFDDAELAWLSKALAASTAHWKVVFAHHPPYSSGKHGQEADLLALRKKLPPLLSQYHVDLYLAGHDHDYERLAPIGGVQYVISGGGGAYLREFGKVLPESQVRKKQHHFLSVTVTFDQMILNAIDTEGRVLDHCVVKKL